MSFDNISCQGTRRLALSHDAGLSNGTVIPGGNWAVSTKILNVHIV